VNCPLNLKGCLPSGHGQRRCRDSTCFCVLRNTALFSILIIFWKTAVPSAVPVIPFHLKFTQGEGENKESVLDYEFTTHDLVSWLLYLTTFQEVEIVLVQLFLNVTACTRQLKTRDLKKFYYLATKSGCCVLNDQRNSLLCGRLIC
jgi:hypothetical protein